MPNVAERIQSFRAKHPDGVITTGHHHIDQHQAIIFAHVAIPNGGTGSGWACRSLLSADDHLFVERAENAALARALSCLGFGLEESDDWSLPQPEEVIVTPDTNIFFAAVPPPPAPPPPPSGPNVELSERQAGMILSLVRDLKLDMAEFDEWCVELFQKPNYLELTRREASAMIDALQKRRRDRHG